MQGGQRRQTPLRATPLMILVAEFVRIWTFGCCVQSLTTSATPENPHFMVRGYPFDASYHYMQYLEA